MIAIKDMEMPQDCGECQIMDRDCLWCRFIGEYCDRLTAWAGRCRPSDCPLIEIKENEE